LRLVSVLAIKSALAFSISGNLDCKSSAISEARLPLCDSLATISVISTLILSGILLISLAFLSVCSLIDIPIGVVSISCFNASYICLPFELTFAAVRHVFPASVNSEVTIFLAEA
jgi:hypothetical protein